jgi:hypothetical protein
MEELTMAKHDSTLERIDPNAVPDLGAPRITFEIVPFLDAALYMVGLYVNDVRGDPFVVNGMILTSPSAVHLRMQMAHVQINGKHVEEVVSMPDGRRAPLAELSAATATGDRPGDARS